MPGGVDAVTAAIDKFAHTGFHREPHDLQDTRLYFTLQQRSFRVTVTFEFDEDYDAKKKPLNEDAFWKALNASPDNHLTVSRNGFVNG